MQAQDLSSSCCGRENARVLHQTPTLVCSQVIVCPWPVVLSSIFSPVLVLFKAYVSLLNWRIVIRCYQGHVNFEHNQQCVDMCASQTHPAHDQHVIIDHDKQGACDSVIPVPYSWLHPMRSTRYVSLNDGPPIDPWSLKSVRFKSSVGGKSLFCSTADFAYGRCFRFGSVNLSRPVVSMHHGEGGAGRDEVLTRYVLIFSSFRLKLTDSMIPCLSKLDHSGSKSVPESFSNERGHSRSQFRLSSTVCPRMESVGITHIGMFLFARSWYTDSPFVQEQLYMNQDLILNRSRFVNSSWEKQGSNQGWYSEFARIWAVSMQSDYMAYL